MAPGRGRRAVCGQAGFASPPILDLAESLGGYPAPGSARRRQKAARRSPAQGQRAGR